MLFPGFQGLKFQTEQKPYIEIAGNGIQKSCDHATVKGKRVLRARKEEV